MLEVLDPEQNNTFRDNYLAVPFDLSRVVFITTANMLDTIPGPLRDRMEIISSRRLHRRARSCRSRAAISSAASWRPTASSRSRSRSPTRRSATIIEHYTREAGVRNLEREIGRALRHAAVRIAEGESGPITIAADDLADDSRSAAVRERGRDAHQRARRGDRPRLDAGRRRHPVHRGDARFRAAAG